MKRKCTSFLAGVLVVSMVATPLSYVKVYAEDQDVTGIVQQEMKEESSSKTGDSQESTPVKEKEMEAEEAVIPSQPEESETEKYDSAKHETVSNE